jgi:hypothetical protein
VLTPDVGCLSGMSVLVLVVILQKVNLILVISSPRKKMSSEQYIRKSFEAFYTEAGLISIKRADYCLRDALPAPCLHRRLESNTEFGHSPFSTIESGISPPSQTPPPASSLSRRRLSSSRNPALPPSPLRRYAVRQRGHRRPLLHVQRRR